MQDIGNVINRTDHAQSGAVMAFRLLDKLSMPAEEICSIVSAIGNHDEATAQPLDPISAALIIADKTDVRRSRVRNADLLTFDIHDRVNYAVEHADLTFSPDKSTSLLDYKSKTQAVLGAGILRDLPGADAPVQACMHLSECALFNAGQRDKRPVDKICCAGGTAGMEKRSLGEQSYSASDRLERDYPGFLVGTDQGTWERISRSIPSGTPMPVWERSWQPCSTSPPPEPRCPSRLP